MGRHKRKVQAGLDARRNTYLKDVPVSDRAGRRRPGSQNRKKSWARPPRE